MNYSRGDNNARMEVEQPAFSLNDSVTNTIRTSDNVIFNRSAFTHINQRNQTPGLLQVQNDEFDISEEEDRMDSRSAGRVSVMSIPKSFEKRKSVSPLKKKNDKN